MEEHFFWSKNFLFTLCQQRKKDNLRKSEAVGQITKVFQIRERQSYTPLIPCHTHTHRHTHLLITSNWYRQRAGLNIWNSRTLPTSGGERSRTHCLLSYFTSICVPHSLLPLHMLLPLPGVHFPALFFIKRFANCSAKQSPGRIWFISHPHPFWDQQNLSYDSIIEV